MSEAEFRELLIKLFAGNIPSYYLKGIVRHVKKNGKPTRFERLSELIKDVS